jgi:hypothetical protein
MATPPKDDPATGRKVEVVVVMWEWPSGTRTLSAYYAGDTVGLRAAHARNYDLRPIAAVAVTMQEGAGIDLLDGGVAVAS